MKRLVIITLVLAGVGCNRAHLYKTAGLATRSAFAYQATAHGAPPPRGLDGEEASIIVNAQKHAAAADGLSAPASGPAKPTGLTLQAR